MPWNYEVDADRRLVRARAWGVLTHDEITGLRLRYTGDPAFQPDFSQLFDLREVTSITATLDELQEVASFSVFGRGARRAFVATNPVPYAFSRMYEAYREFNGGQEEIEVFRSIEDAEKWLGLTTTGSV
jgi:hypothetical protein